MKMQIPFLDLKTQYQSIKHEIDPVVADIFSNASFIGGPIVNEFEQKFAAFCDAQYCIGVGNGTDALFIALRALDIGPGDEVITVANSFIASSEAISMTGAKVVFVDCDVNTYGMDVTQLTSKINSKTKAIIPVHLYGCPANMPVIMQIAKKHNLFVIEDAAQAHGASIDGKKIGTWGDAACFSFYPGKNLGAYGDAGAIVTNNEALSKRIRMWANHGRITKYDHEFEGVNSRLDTLQAAILKVKLAHLGQWIEKRRQVAAWYKQWLSQSDLILPIEPIGFYHTYHLFVVRVKNRDAIIAALKAEGIETGIHYPIGLPFLKAYQHLAHQPQDFPVTYQFQSEILSLPLYPELTETQVRYVCEQVLNAVSINCTEKVS